MKKPISLFLSVFLTLAAAQPVRALAPATSAAAAPPRLKLDLSRFEVKSNSGAVWELEQRRTGDRWLLEFDSPSPLYLDGETELALPLPRRIGIKIPAQHGTEIVSWIPGPAEGTVFLELEWKWRLFRQASLLHLKPMNLAEEFEPIPDSEWDLYLHPDLLGKEKLFTRKEKKFLKGDGIWGIPVRRRNPKNPKNGEKPKEYLFIYRDLISAWSVEEGKIPRPQEIGYVEAPERNRVRWVSRRLTAVAGLDERIAQEQLQLRETEPAAARRERLRHLNGLVQIRREWEDEIAFLDAAKIKRRQMEEDPARFFGRNPAEGEERRDWDIDRRKGPRRNGQPLPPSLKRERRKQNRSDRRSPFSFRRKSDREPFDLDEKIRSRQWSLLLDRASQVERELHAFEVQELEDFRDRNGALILRNSDGDEIGYYEMGAASSPHPPIVLFIPETDPSENLFLQRLAKLEQGRKFLESRRLWVVTPLGSPYRTGDKRKPYPLKAAHAPAENRYWLRLAEAFALVLSAEEVSAAYLAGTGDGALAAQEAARLYGKRMPLPDGTTVKNPVRGVILIEPRVVSPLVGAEAATAEDWPLLSRLPAVGGWLRRSLDTLRNETPLGSWPQWGRGGASLILERCQQAILVREKRGRSRSQEEDAAVEQENTALSRRLAALRWLTREAARDNLAALKGVPVVAFMPTAAPETRFFCRAVPAAEVHPSVGGHASVQLRLMSLFLDRNGAGGNRHAAPDPRSASLVAASL